MKVSSDISRVKEVLEGYRIRGKVLLAYLYGSYAKGTQNAKSDIDLALYIEANDEKEIVGIIDGVLMASEKPVEVLRLDDEEESPFIVQEALKGIPLVEPEIETLYRVARRALHDAESIRYRRAVFERV